MHSSNSERANRTAKATCLAETFLSQLPACTGNELRQLVAQTILWGDVAWTQLALRANPKWSTVSAATIGEVVGLLLARAAELDADKAPSSAVRAA